MECEGLILQSAHDQSTGIWRTHGTRDLERGSHRGKRPLRDRGGQLLFSAGCGQERAAQAERDAYDLRLERHRFLLRRCGWRAGEQGRRLVLSGSEARGEEHCRLRRILEGRESASVNCVTLATQPATAAGDIRMDRGIWAIWYELPADSAPR